MNNYLKGRDQLSLKIIADIKNNEVVDIYDNGTLSEPYPAGNWDLQGFKTSAWRTFRWLSGYGNNRDDIPKIRALMERTLLAYRDGYTPLKDQLENAILGLNNLRQYYTYKKKEATCTEIDKIVSFVKDSIIEIEKTGFKEIPEKERKRHRELALLEGSHVGLTVVNEGTYGPIEGIEYYREKIKDFLFFEKNLTEEELTFFNHLDASLQKAKKNYNKRIKIDVKMERAQLLCNWADKKARLHALNQADEELHKELAEKIVCEIDTAPQNIGISFPMRWGWEHDYRYEGHIFFINVSKEVDGSYTVAQSNAGGLALGECDASISVHLNPKVPRSINLPPIVEFNCLTKEEVIGFLKNVKKIEDGYLKDRTDAKQKYEDLFAPLMEKKRASRIPSRRGQIVNNCGVRSLKEQMIYSFQKSGQIDLANRFFRFADPRGDWALNFDEIKALN